MGSKAKLAPTRYASPPHLASNRLIFKQPCETPTFGVTPPKPPTPPPDKTKTKKG